MKPVLFLCSLLLMQVLSTANAAVPYAPYADLTLQVHWDNNAQELEPLDLASISQATGIKRYHLAFITDAGRCEPAWGAQPSYSVKRLWASHLTERLTAANIDYIVSFGGAVGSDISLNCNKDQLIAVYDEIIQKYKPQGLDFDIENSTANIGKIIDALKSIQKKHPKVKISFTLPVMPEGLVAQGQSVIQAAQSAALNFSVNIMTMDYGPAYSGDMGQYAIQAATNLHGFLKNLYPHKSATELWQMIEVTPMIGVNDVAVEMFTLSNAKALALFAKQKSLGGLAMWSIARDNPCSDSSASNICSGKNLQTRPYEYSAMLMG